MRTPVVLSVVAVVAALVPVSVHWEFGGSEGGLGLVAGLGAVVRVSEACARQADDPYDGCEPEPWDFCSDHEGFIIDEHYTCAYPERGSGCI